MQSALVAIFEAFLKIHNCKRYDKFLNSSESTENNCFLFGGRTGQDLLTTFSMELCEAIEAGTTLRMLKVGMSMLRTLISIRQFSPKETSNIGLENNDYLLRVLCASVDLPPRILSCIEGLAVDGCAKIQESIRVVYRTLLLCDGHSLVKQPWCSSDGSPEKTHLLNLKNKTAVSSAIQIVAIKHVVCTVTLHEEYPEEKISLCISQSSNYFDNCGKSIYGWLAAVTFFPFFPFCEDNIKKINQMFNMPPDSVVISSIDITMPKKKTSPEVLPTEEVSSDLDCLNSCIFNRFSRDVKRHHLALVSKFVQIVIRECNHFLKFLQTFSPRKMNKEKNRSDDDSVQTLHCDRIREFLEACDCPFLLALLAIDYYCITSCVPALESVKHSVRLSTNGTRLFTGTLLKSVGELEFKLFYVCEALKGWNMEEVTISYQ